MKKIVSILLTVAMLLMSMSAFCVMAEEASTTVSAFADYDFADYDGTAIKDKNGNLGNPWSYARPTVGTHTSPDGQTTVKYAQWDDTVEGMFAQLGGGQSVSKVLDNNDVTVEMWVKLPDIADVSQSGKWPEFFNVTNNGTKLWTLEAAYSTGYNGYMVLNAEGSGAGKYQINQGVDLFANKWAHVVTTRSYDTATKWLYFKLYVNGVLMGMTSKQVDTFTKGNSIELGTSYYNRTNAGKRFGGAFGQIRIYNSELTSSDIAAKYDERKAIYQTEEQINYSQTEKFFNNYRTIRNDDWSNYNGSSAGSYWLSNPAPKSATHTSEDGTSVKYMQWNKEDTLFMQMGLNQGAANILAYDSVTAEMWVKFPDIGSEAESGCWPLFYTVANNGGTALWSLETAYSGGGNNGYIAIKGVSDYKQVFKVGDLLGGKWAHIVTSRTYTPATGTTVLKLYINGELMATVSEEKFERGTSINLGTTYYQRTQDNKKWSGGFGMLKMYNGELSEAMIEEKYNEKKAIYQTMDDTAVYEANIANGTTDSISGHNTDGTWVSNLETKDYDNGAGVTTKYFNFDGTSNRFWSYGSGAQLPTRRFITNNEETSVEMWLNSNSFNSVNYRPFSITDGSGKVENIGSWYLEIGNGGIAQYAKNSLLGNKIIPMTGKENQWFHVVATRDFNKTAKTITYKTYIDGELKDTYVLENQTSIYDCGETTGAVYFGNIYPNMGNDQAYEQFNGGIAKAKVYKSILTDAKVAALYNAKKADLKDAGILEVTEVIFEGETEGTSINELKDNSTVWCQVSLKNSSKQEDKHYVAYGAIYDGDGKLVSIVELNNDSYYGTVEKNTTATASYIWKNLLLDEGSTLKVFVWSTDEIMVPVSSEVYELPWECA